MRAGLPTRAAVATVLAWWVLGVALAGASYTASASATGAVSSATLATPTGLSQSVSGSTVTLSWTATTSTFATGTRVFRASVSGGPYTAIADVSPRATTTYNDTPGSGTWYYVVRAYFSGWTSAATSQVSGLVGCTSPGSQTVTADADATIEQAHATTNSGTAAALSVASGNVTNIRALVHFALPSLPSGCSVTAASLKLVETGGVAGRTLNANLLAATWSESSVTWANQPATSGTAATASSALTGTVTWTVTSSVQSLYSGTNTGFGIRDSAEGQTPGATQTFSSREGLNPPQLVITFG